MGFQLLHVSWCGPFPYFTSKERCLRERGFLHPRVLGALHLIACDPMAYVEREAGYPHDRVAISRDSVTVVVSDHCGMGMPVILTAFVAGNPTYPAVVVMNVASRVNFTDLIALDERLRGEA